MPILKDTDISTFSPSQMLNILPSVLQELKEVSNNTEGVARRHPVNGYELWVETPANGGSDETGDGSQEKPFATMKAALNALPIIPETPSDFATIYFGPGDFEFWGVYKGLLSSIYIAGAFGSTEDLVVSTVTPVSGSAVEVDIQMTTDIQTVISAPGEAQLEPSFGAAYRDFFLYSDVVLSKPASDTIRVSANWWGNAPASSVKLSTKATRFVFPVTEGAPRFSFSRDVSVYLSGIAIDWTGYAGSNSLTLGPVNLYSCSVICPKTVLWNGADERNQDTVASCYIKCTNDFQIQGALGHSSSWFGNVFDSTRLLFFRASGPSIARPLLMNNAQILVDQSSDNFASSGIHLNANVGVRDCATPFTTSGPSSSMTFGGDLSIQGACTRWITVDQGARVAFNESSSVGSCSDIPVQITEGVVTGAANLAFTNSTTPGEEIKVGGLAAQSFASLPNADFTGAAATGSRAT